MKTTLGGKADQVDVIRKTLAAQGSEYLLKRSWVDHVGFLAYWHGTQGKGYTKKTE